MRRLAVIICSLLLALAARAQDAAPLLAWVTATAAAKPLSLSPVLHLPLDGSLVDLAGNAQAVWSNTAEYGEGPWDGTQCAVFRYDQYIDTQWGMGLYPETTNEWSIALWYNVAPTDRCVLFGRQSSLYPNVPGGRIITMVFNRPLTAALTPSINLAGIPINSTGLLMDTGDWEHFVLVWNGTEGLVYFDAEYKASVAAGWSTPNVSQEPLVLGRLGYQATLAAAKYLGKAAHFMVFDKALTPEEITQLYEWRP